MYNNAKEIFMKNKKVYSIATIVIVLLVIVAIMYSLGFRFKNNFTIGKIGEVVVNVEVPSTNIYIDESKMITTGEANDKVELKFSPRTHSLIVHKEGYLPWKKDFVVPSGGVLELDPVFIPQNPGGVIITNSDPEYQTIRNRILKDSLPEHTSPIISSDGVSVVWVEDNAIMAQIDETRLEVMEPDTIIRNIAFYKNRNDYVVFSTSGSIYAIELDKTGGQNFLPIYRGVKPSFIKGEENFIYVLDGENLMQINL